MRRNAAYPACEIENQQCGIRRRPDDEAHSVGIYRRSSRTPIFDCNRASPARPYVPQRSTSCQPAKRLSSSRRVSPIAITSMKRQTLRCAKFPADIAHYRATAAISPHITEIRIVPPAPLHVITLASREGAAEIARASAWSIISPLKRGNCSASLLQVGRVRRFLDELLQSLMVGS